MQGWEAHHSAQSLQAEAQDSPSTPKTLGKRIKWPAATGKKAWYDFDEDVSEILEITSSGQHDSVDKRLLTTAKIIVSYAEKRYGYEERKKNVTSKENRRERKIKDLRKDLKSLTKQYKRVKPEEKESLQELRNIIQLNMRSLQRAEWHRRRRKERARKILAFISNLK